MKYFLYISKDINGKFSISALPGHFLKGYLTKKIFGDLSFLVSDPSKKWSDNPEMKNFLYIGKCINEKFLISGMANHFLKGSLTIKLNSKKIFLVRDPFKKWPGRAEIENFPLMSLLIY